MSSRPDIADRWVDLWRVRLAAPVFALDEFEAVLADFGNPVSYGDPAKDGRRIDPGDDRPADVWRIETLCEAEPDFAALRRAIDEVALRLGLESPEIEVDLLPATDWLAQNRTQFRPVRAGRFFVSATFDETPAPPGAIALRIDAGPAFGSGQHPTTSGCLRAIETLLRRRRFCRPLDLGCGSGILALALAARQHRAVLAIDNDPWAVRTTRDNARANRLAAWIDARLGDGLARVPVARKFDLICANILARPLVRLAPAIAAHLAPGGAVILSGLLDYQEARVRAAYRIQGLGVIGRSTARSEDGGLWPTLIVARRAV